MPVIAILLTISSLSLVGIPGTVGFISKWYLIIGALEQGWWLVVLSLAISSLLALIYVGRVIELMWFHQPEDAINVNSKSLPVEMLAITFILTLATVYFGIDTRLTAGLAEIAVHNVLLGGQ